MSREARLLFIAVYALVGFGIVMTYSASAVYADHVFQNAQHFLLRQILYAALGTVALFAAAALPVDFWKEHARTLVMLAMVLLLLVFVPVLGHSAGGAQRWIALGLFHFQPAEFAKVALCLYLADYLARKKKGIQQGGLKIFAPPLLVVVSVCTLTLLQPDLGSTAFIFLMVLFLFFWAGLRLRYLAAASIVFAPLFYFLIIQAPYRLSRITAYLNPWEDPQGTGFQIIQSFLAFGLGGIRGVGLGQGIQKLFYLPSSYNDFIFSIVGEELGLMGTYFVVALYAVIFVCGVLMAERARQEYERLLIVSLTFLIVMQALIHMFVTTGLIPTKGLPLPFMSFGGTSLFFSLLVVGILLGVDRGQSR